MPKSEFHHSESRQKFLLLVSVMHLAQYTKHLYYCTKQQAFLYTENYTE